MGPGLLSLRRGLAAGLAWPGRTVAERRAKLVRVATFADALRDINRRVCIDTYASYHFVARYGDHPHAARCVRPELLAALGAIHAARRRGAELTTAEKRHAFEAHFLGEQATIVGPAIERRSPNSTGRWSGSWRCAR